MNNNLNRHRLLKILSDQYIKANLGQGRMGVSWDELAKKMGCSLEQLLEICATLFAEEEVDKHDAYDVKGIYAKMKGVSSYTNRKYKKENNKLIFDEIKNWVQILIPVLSLIVTLYVVISSERRIETKNIEFNKVNERLKSIEIYIKEIKLKTEKPDTVKLNP